MPKRSAIALLITVFFIIAISISLGISLKQVKEASNEVESEAFMLQSALILEDVSNILKNSQELDAVIRDNSIESFFLFLSEVGFIPFESDGMKVSIEIASARSKFNINSLRDANSSNPQKTQAMQEYLGTYAINDDYVGILLDNMSQIKEDNSYNSAIFNDNPTLFRDYIVSQKHLDEINNFYMQNTHENAITKVDFEKLFYFSKDGAYSVDVNYATKETWRLMLGCDELRAEELALGGGFYIKEEDLALSDVEKEMLKRFATSFYEPYLDVKVAISKNDQSAFIRFEYDMKTKKGSNFVYEI
ncbi:MAG: hypothetical protein FP820_09170 [Sulfurimonas sp.]|jgi:hypothetical protein|nr:hypothetical protein [Sulfurimonas sp.]MBU1216457.1 hypothetical protein [bacterium]MBU1433466.1 hypothetical protein [bacterium]MBU1503352.1 hypothetical protein [bacterium]MBU3938322.1 hypothetical protein [bacterium]